jgi:serine/threonine protein kinase/glycine cleavage system regulatory protein/CRP-like cAMP-binding protein
MAPSFIAMDDATGAQTPDSSSLFKSTRITQCGVMPLQCAGVEVSNKLNATCTVVKVMAQDRPRLLLDLAAFFQRSAHNVVEADVTTSPTSEMASDIFLVQQSDGRKIAKPRKLAEDIRDVVLNSAGTAADGSPKPSPVKAPRPGAASPLGDGDGDGDVPAVRAGEGLEKSGETYQVDLKKVLEDGEPDIDDGGDANAVSNDDGSLSETRDSDERRGDDASRADPSKTKKDRRVSRVLARGDGVKLTNTHREMVDLQNATEISLEVPDRVGLLADVCQCLVRNNVSVVNAHIYTTSDGLASNYFSVRDAATNERVRDEVLEEMRQALAARCHMRPGKKRSVEKGLALTRADGDGDGDGDGSGNPAAAESSLTSWRGSPLRRFPSIDGDPRGGPLVSQYASETLRKKGEGMVRAHGGEVLEHDYDTQRRLLASKNVKHADLTKIEPIDVAALDYETRHVVELAMNALPAYASLTFPSAKKEIFGEFREVRWAPGETAFDAHSPVPNLYVILEGALHREAFLRHGKTPVPGNVLSRGALYGEAALQHAYLTKARVVSENGEREGVATRAFAVSGETFKRIVRARIHRARRLLANVLSVVETFRLAPPESKELLLNALWSGSAARRPGEAFAGPGARVGKKPSDAAAAAFNVSAAPYAESGKKASGDRQKASSESAADGRGRAMHVILEGEVVRVTADGVRTILKAGESFGEDWLLSDAARAEMALAENAAGRALRREASTAYVASSSYQPVTLEITRTTLRTLWGPEFDDYLRSRHDVAAGGALVGQTAEGAVSETRRASRDGRGSTDSETGARVPRRSGSLPDLDPAGRDPSETPRKPQIPPTPVEKSVSGTRESIPSSPPAKRASPPAAAVPASGAKSPKSPKSRSFLKTLSKTIKRAMGVPSKKQKRALAARDSRIAREASDDASDTEASSDPAYAEASESDARRKGGGGGDSEDASDEAVRASAESTARSATAAAFPAAEDVVPELHSFASPKSAPPTKSAPPPPGMTRVGTMLDIRDARDAGGSPGRDPSGREGTFSKLSSKPNRVVAGKKDAPLEPRGALRNAHSVMDIASLSRSEDVVCSVQQPEGDTKASLRETRADGGEEKKAPAPSSSAASDATSASRASDATSYAATATAMGMSEEAFRESTLKAADAANEKQRAPSPLDAYVFAKQLGVGLTGSVYKAWRRVSASPASHSGVEPGDPSRSSAPVRWVPVAVKVMDKVKILDINETAHVVQESKIMRSVSRHPFIVSMIESFQTESAMFIAMEYAAAKDLFHMIHEHGALRLSQCRAFVVQTVLALDHVHAKGFVYRDLKPENLLVREDGYLRLTDFGFAKALRPGERAYTVCGTPDYLAPETLRQQGCTRAADFWAVGVLLFEMLTGYPPFHGQTHSELYRRITSGRVRAFPRGFDEDAADLVNKLLRQSEGERVGVGADGIQRIRRHPFFKGFSWTAVLEQRAPMHRPAVARDPDRGPEDVKNPVTPECLAKPCALNAEEQALFAAF